jgi:hypothetical protein
VGTSSATSTASSVAAAAADLPGVLHPTVADGAVAVAVAAPAAAAFPPDAAGACRCKKYFTGSAPRVSPVVVLR